MGTWQIAVRTFVLGLGAAPACAHAADPPLDMAAASGWVVDYADDSCALRRAFSAAYHEVILELRQFSPANGFYVLLVSDTLSRSRTPPRVRFEPDSEWYEPSAPLFVDNGQQRGVLYFDNLRSNAELRDAPSAPWTEEERDAREEAIAALLVTRSFEHELKLQTGKMHAPMTAMRVCLDELVTHWGLDAAAQRTLTRAARPTNMENWSQRIQRNYPREMIRRGLSGIIHLRLTLGANGRPTACRVQLEISQPDFEEAACETMVRHARFEPALDVAGAPIASYFVTTIIYQTER